MATKPAPNRATRRSTATPKPKAVPDKPNGPAVVVDLLERESHQEEPFIVALPGGTQIELLDPSELPFQVVASNNPTAILAEALSDEDWNAMIDAELKAWQLGEIVKKWRDHFGVGSQGELNV